MPGTVCRQSIGAQNALSRNAQLTQMYSVISANQSQPSNAFSNTTGLHARRLKAHQATATARQSKHSKTLQAHCWPSLLHRMNSLYSYGGGDNSNRANNTTPYFHCIQARTQRTAPPRTGAAAAAAAPARTARSPQCSSAPPRSATPAAAPRAPPARHPTRTRALGCHLGYRW